MHTRKAFTFCSSTHVTVSLLWQNFLTVAYIDTEPWSIPDLLKHIQTFICLVGICPLSTSGWFYDHWETAALGVDPCWSNWTLSLAVFIKQAAVHHHSPHPPCIFKFSPITFQNETHPQKPYPTNHCWILKRLQFWPSKGRLGKLSQTKANRHYHRGMRIHV